MKRTLLLISAVLLSMMAWGQKLTLYMAGNQTYEYDISQVDSMVFSDASTVEPEEIVVTVDASGNADGGHQFSRIDETTFIIDGLKYKYQNGGLTVIGYDQVLFSGIAKIISKLIYNGRTINVLDIGYQAFYNCTTLTSVTIPNSVTSIGYGAFYSCSNLTSINIPNSVTSIGEWAFAICPGLTSVTIPNSVTSIEGWAFYNCRNLSSITIPNSVTSIGEHAFQDCTCLTSFTIPNSVTYIWGSAFRGCTSLTSVTIESGITYISSAVFQGCTSLASIIIPESVTSIGKDAFLGTAWYNNQPEGLVYAGKVAYIYKGTMPEETQITIEDGTLAIAEAAFSSCETLISVTIPNSVTNIGDNAFGACSRLTTVIVGNGITCIVGGAFSGCSKLTDFYCYAENVPETWYSLFESSSISSATLHVPAGSVEAYSTTEPWSYFGSIVAIE